MPSRFASSRFSLDRRFVQGRTRYPWGGRRRGHCIAQSIARSICDCPAALRALQRAQCSMSSAGQSSPEGRKVLPTPGLTLPALSAHALARLQAPADLESQLVELQKKYRMLEVGRGTTGVGARRATHRPAPDEPQGVLGGCAGHHPAPASRNREAAGGQHGNQARAGRVRKRAHPWRTPHPGLSPPSAQDAGAPNLSMQQELLRLRETALVFTRKARSRSASALRPPHPARSWRLRRSATRRWMLAYASTTQERSRNGGPWGASTRAAALDRHPLPAQPPLAGVNAAKEDTQQVANQIKALESKLDKALVKLNEAVNRNKLLRNDIDHLRKERVVFDQASTPPPSSAPARVPHSARPHARCARRLSESSTRRSVAWPPSSM